MARIKTCHLCGKTKPITDFIRDRAKASGYRGPCKKCKNRREIKRIRANPKQPTTAPKKCSNCGQEKPADCFQSSQRTSDGLHTLCKDCAKEYLREYRIKNKRKSPTNSPKTCPKCGETKPAKDFRRAINNPDGRDYECRQCARAYERERYAANPQARIDRDRVRRQTNQAVLRKHNIIQMRRRVRKMNVSGEYTPDDIQAILKKQRNRCVYCSSNIKNSFTVDHIIPLSQDGSSNWPENIQLLCRSCNSRKNNRSHNEYVAWLLENDPDSNIDTQLSLQLT